MKKKITLAMAWLALCAGAGMAEPSQLQIPKIGKAPELDGKIAPGEWDGAAAVSGFIGATGVDGGKLSSPDATIYLAHDGEYIYIAVRNELLPGMVPSRTFRKRDQPVYMDNNQVEIWLSPPVEGPDVTFQTIINAYGAIFDMRNVPSLGAESAGWSGAWESANSFERGKAWISELRVPFKSFENAAYDPAKTWGGLIAVAWPQRSWPYTAGWYKNFQNHARYTFADTGNAVQLLNMSKLFANTLAPELRLVNAGDQAGDFTVAFHVGDVGKTEKVTVPARASQAYTFSLPLPESPDKRTCVARVTDPAGKVLLAGEWAFKPEDLSQRPAPRVSEPPRPFATRVQFGPETAGLALWADTLDYPKIKELASVRFTVRPEGGAPLLTHSVTNFAYDSAEAMLWLPKPVKVGKYQVVTTFLNTDGQTLDEKTDGFEQVDLAREYRWYNNTIGEKRKVAPPFEPVTVKGRSLKVWGRDYAMVGALPEQVTSQGQAMLSGPVTFKAIINGATVEAKVKEPFKVTKVGEARTEFRGRYELAGVDFTVMGAMEMDGVMLYDLTTNVRDAAKLAGVERLYLSVPVKARHATTFYSTGGGWSGAFGEIPQKKDGTVWTSATTADFVPYVGLTDDDRAIQWFADNDHDWALGPDAPCAAILRMGDTVEIQINIVRTTNWDGQLAARFGLVATPVKALPSGWRNTSLDNGDWYGATTRLMFGQGHGGCTIDPHDTAKLAKVIGLETTGKTPYQIDDLLASTPPQPWTQERIKAMCKEHGLNPDHIQGLWNSDQNRPANGVRGCYFFNANMYFEGTRAAAFRQFFPAEWSLQPAGGWFHGTPTESFRDFFAFYMDVWAKHWFLGGLYFDECYFGLDYNVFNGNGKVMADGRVRPSVPLLQQRELMWRMWQIFHDNGRQPFIWVHTSNYMAPHANGVADIAMYGEDRAPNAASDYIDNTPALLFRTIGRGQKFGYVPVWMDQAGRTGFMQGSRQVWGWVWMHDAVPEYHTCQFTMPTLGMRVAWGIAQDDVSYIPYWSNQAVETGDKQAIASVWVRPEGKAMILVMNLDKQSASKTVKLKLDGKRLGLKEGFKVYDLESKPEVVEALAAAQAWKDGRLGPDANKLQYAAFAKTRDQKPFQQYVLDELKTVGDTTGVSISVPARDWVLLIAE